MTIAYISESQNWTFGQVLIEILLKIFKDKVDTIVFVLFAKLMMFEIKVNLNCSDLLLILLKEGQKKSFTCPKRLVHVLLSRFYPDNLDKIWIKGHGQH